MPPAMANDLHQWQARAIQEGTKQLSMFAVAIPFIIITSVVVGLRVFVRLSLVQAGLGYDDYLMISGTFFAICLSIANMFCGYYGAGVHVGDIPPENLIPLLKSNYATRLLYVVALCFVKFSILVFYMRIDPRKWTRYAVYFLMFNVAGLSIATFGILAFVCSPPSLFWNPEAQAASPEKCMAQSRQQIFFNANGILNIVQDIGIYVLPIPMLWKLQMPSRQKIALIALLGVGVIAVVAGCVRYSYVLSLANEADLWYYMADSLNWCSIEIYAAIICGSASTFKALLRTYLPSLWGSSRGNSAGPRHQYNQSRSGQFVMKPFGSSSMKSNTNAKYGINDLTTAGYGSEEAIVSEPKENGDAQRANETNNGITMKKEITMHVSDAPTSSADVSTSNPSAQQPPKNW